MSGFRAFNAVHLRTQRPHGRTGADVSIYFDLRLLLLVPAFAAVGLMVWVFLNLARDIGRHRRHYAGFNPRRRDKSEFWE
jgi:hypothetical protein